MRSDSLRPRARGRRERSIFLFDCVKVLLIGLNGPVFTFGVSGHGVQFLDSPWAGKRRPGITQSHGRK